MIEHPMSGKKLFIFDVDGTLRRPCPNAPDEWEVIPGVHETLAQYHWGREHHVALVTNQGGVGPGHLSPQTVAMVMRLLRDLRTQLWTDEVRVPIMVCSHPPQYGCACRKPSPYFLLHVVTNCDLRSEDTIVGCSLGQAVIIGDMLSDKEAAQRAGIDFVWSHEFFGWTFPQRS